MTYEGIDKSIESTVKSFRIEYFLVIIDSALLSLKKRFELYTNHTNKFGFFAQPTWFEENEQREANGSLYEITVQPPGSKNEVILKT